MRKLSVFLKTTALGGLFVLLPVLLLFLLLKEILELAIALATPIADLFPKGIFDQIYLEVLEPNGRRNSFSLPTFRI
jgi:hypothetical protein